MPVQTKSQANTLKIPKKMKKLKPGKLAYLKKMEEKAKKEFKYKHTELADPVMVKKQGKEIGKACAITRRASFAIRCCGYHATNVSTRAVWVRTRFMCVGTHSTIRAETKLS